MPEFREKPKGERPKAKHTPPLSPQQAGRLMAEKYRQQIEQGREEPTTAEGYATDQAQGAAESLIEDIRIYTPHRRPKERPAQDSRSTPKETVTPGHRPKERPPQASAPKEKPLSPAIYRIESGATQPSGQASVEGERQPSDQKQGQDAHFVHVSRRHPKGPKERTTPIAKERPAPPQQQPPLPYGDFPMSHGATPTTGEPVAVPPQFRVETTTYKIPRIQEPSQAPLHIQPSGHIIVEGHPRTMPRQREISPLKERPRTVFKPASAPKIASTGPSVKATSAQAAKGARTAARQLTQRRMAQQMIEYSKRATGAIASYVKKAAQAIVKTAKALISSAMFLIGGGALIALIVVVAVVGAVAGSPFGLFFAAEPNAPNTVSVAQAVATVTAEYNTKLEELQAGDYDGIDVQGQAAEWSDVLAVFAARNAASDVGVDVATLDPDRVSRLTTTFWDMTEIASYVETIPHPDSDPDDGVDDSWTEYILHITITAKSIEDMKTLYSFTPYQTSALEELLSDRAALSSLAGSLTITDTDLQAVLSALPETLTPDRQRAVETALQLVGKVNYFWGGKSSAIGWDSRWGQLTLVTEPGNSTTGTYRPLGLDCSGFLDWAFRNAELQSAGHWYIGTNLTEVSQADALPGDIALFADASHLGLIVGRDSTGKLLVCHCSAGRNNVAVTEFAETGFTVIGRPSIYG